MVTIPFNSTWKCPALVCVLVTIDQPFSIHPTPPFSPLVITTLLLTSEIRILKSHLLVKLGGDSLFVLGCLTYKNLQFCPLYHKWQHFVFNDQIHSVMYADLIFHVCSDDNCHRLFPLLDYYEWCYNNYGSTDIPLTYWFQYATQEQNF